MEITIIIIMALTGIILICSFLFNADTKETLNDEPRKRYTECLKGTDKKAALEAGRIYYNTLRKDGRLNMYDELAIANDLSAMNVSLVAHDLHVAQTIKLLKWALSR